MEKKTFIDFILDSTESKELTMAFLKTDTKEGLKAVFEKWGYSVAAKDLDKIMEIKNKLPKNPPWGPKPSPFY